MNVKVFARAPLGAALLLVCVLIPVRASAQCCRVEGIIRSDNGSSLAAATVVLSAPQLKAPVSTTIAADGRYAFDNVPPGIWAQVRVLMSGRSVAQGTTLVTLPVETLNITVSSAPVTVVSADDLKPQGGEWGELRGTVRAVDGTPLAGARVGIANAEIVTTTDSEGRFSFGRVRAPLTIDLSAAATGYESATKSVSVDVRQTAGTDIELTAAAPQTEEAPLGIAETPRDRQSMELRSSELSGIPSLAPFDVFRAIQLLPATWLSDDRELALDGTPPGSTLVTIDGIPWFPSQRLAGAIGAPLNTTFFQEATLSPVNLGSAGGGQLGGELALSGRPIRPDRPDGTLDVSAFGIAGAVAIPLSRFGSIAVGGRTSPQSSTFSDVLNWFAGPDQTWLHDRTPVLPGTTVAPLKAPSFSDLNVRADITPGAGNHFMFAGYDGRDNGNFSRDIFVGTPTGSIIVPPEITFPPDATSQMADMQAWTGRGWSAGWSRQWSRAVSTNAVVAQSQFTTSLQRSVLITSPTSGGDYNLLSGLGGSNGTSEANEIRDTDVRAEASIDPGFNHAVQVGFERTTLDTTYDAQVAALFHLPAGATTSKMVNLLTRDETGHVSTIFGQDTWSPMPKLTVSPGTRVSWYDLGNRTYVDPRVTATYLADPRSTFKATWQIDHQAAIRMDHEDLWHGDTSFWTLADGSAVPLARSQEISADAIFQVPGLLFDMKIYYRWLNDLTMFAPRLLPGEVPPSGSSMLYNGYGTSLGVELMVQYRRSRNGLWVSYTGGKTEYTFPSLEASPFPASFDRRHQVKTADALKVWKGLSVSAVMLVGTGAPYTPATTAEPVWFANGDVAYQPAFQAKNSAVMPLYSRLDLSSQYDLHIGPAITSAGVAVFNVYDANNVWYPDFQVTGPSLTQTDTFLMRRFSRWRRATRTRTTRPGRPLRRRRPTPSPRRSRRPVP